MTLDYKPLFEKIQSQEIVVIDIRGNHEFFEGHIPGSVNVPFSTYGWARSIKSWLDGHDIDVAVVGEQENLTTRAESELKSVGLKVALSLSDNLAGWNVAGMPLSSIKEITPDELYSQIDRWTIIDVREPYEWQSGSIKNSLKIPMNELPSRLSEFNSSDRYAIVCAHGNRSEMAAVFLADNGLKAATLVGGIYRWMNEQHPVEYEE